MVWSENPPPERLSENPASFLIVLPSISVALPALGSPFFFLLFIYLFIIKFGLFPKHLLLSQTV